MSRHGLAHNLAWSFGLWLFTLQGLHALSTRHFAVLAPQADALHTLLQSGQATTGLRQEAPIALQRKSDGSQSDERADTWAWTGLWMLGMVIVTLLVICMVYCLCLSSRPQTEEVYESDGEDPDTPVERTSKRGCCSNFI
eukprot:g42977.t1